MPKRIPGCCIAKSRAWRGVLVATLVTVATALAWSDPAVASAAWSVQSTVNPFVGGSLSGVSCASTTACVAVGGYVNSTNRPEMLAEEWNGSAWKISATPNPSGVLDSSLTGASCPSANTCIAIGTGLDTLDNGVVLAAQWNGINWSVQTVPAPAYSGLVAVSCTAANACTAVGEANESSTSGMTLAEEWNGTTWTTQSTRNPSGSTISSLSSVSCTEDSTCTAVGYYVDATGSDIALAEQWTPTGGWTISPPAVPAGATSSVLTGVSCTSASACTAVGHYVNSSNVEQMLAEHWDGSSWTVTLSPSVATSSTLAGVSCTAENSCTAVGQGNGKPIGVQWNGSSWSTTLTGGASGALSGISCAGAAACTGVGQASGATLAEHWNGTAWARQATPNPPGTGVLSGVSCTAAMLFCAAVGYSSPTAALAERWNGTKWTVAPSLSTGATALHPVLPGVSCTAANLCMAAGAVQHVYCYPRPPYCHIINGAVAMQWNGSSWTRLSTPNPSQTTSSQFTAVSCPAANACTAVGASGSSTLAEAWDGTTWTIQSTAASGLLSGVSCPSTNSCTAVGASGSATLAETWNGGAWTTQSTPNPSGATSSALSGISCASADACLAVGRYASGSGASAALAESRTATGGWSITLPATPTGAASTVLRAVSCTSATSCIAVGHYVNGSGVHKTLAEQWNGSAWTIQGTPNPGGESNANLSGVSCTAATVCTAVGDYVNTLGIDVTLGERYAGS